MVYKYERSFNATSEAVLPGRPREKSWISSFMRTYIRSLKMCKDRSLQRCPARSMSVNYLRYSSISAYATMNIPAKEWGQESTLQAPLDNTELIDRILNAAYERRFGPPGQPSLLKCLFQELIDEIKLTRDNVEREDGLPLPRASLCWGYRTGCRPS